MVTKGVFAARRCPDGWVPYAESCYLGLDGSMKGDWTTAVMQCDQNNASIMVPSSDGENDFIDHSFQRHDQSSFGVWINCNDAEVEGEWNCYEDGQNPTEYRKWEPNQPDDDRKQGDQDYGFMITSVYSTKLDTVIGSWGDAWEVSVFFVICERPQQGNCDQSALDMYCLTADESTGRFTPRCLFNHTLGSYPTDTVAACKQRCMERQDCRSFNIKRNSSGSMPRVCELNNATRYQVLGEYFQESAGCYYYDFKCF
ncbi:uncharacterized protein [Asterias amurensis]|uniref:uncharacterized protein n=1 Tax=Asterias amurensis TaxID=7602 RepID=UPI003AB6671A